MPSRAIGSVRTTKQIQTGPKSDGSEHRSGGAEVDIDTALRIAELFQQAAEQGAVKVGWHHRPSDQRLNVIAYFE